MYTKNGKGFEQVWHEWICADYTIVRSSSASDNKVLEQREHHSLWHSGLHCYRPVRVSRLTFVTNNTHKSIRIGPLNNERGWPDRSCFILHPCGCASFSQEHMVISMYRKVCKIHIRVKLSFLTSSSVFSFFQENHTGLIPSSEAQSTEGNSCSVWNYSNIRGPQLKLINRYLYRALQKHSFHLQSFPNLSHNRHKNLCIT